MVLLLDIWNSKMIRILKNIRFFFCLFVVLGCETYDIRLSVANNTNDTLFFVVSKTSDYKSDSFNRPFLDDKPARYYVRKLNPHDTVKVENYGKDSWPNYVTKAANNRLHIFFFSKEIIESYDWVSIYENKSYLVHNVYDIEGLEKINWNIQYSK